MTAGRLSDLRAAFDQDGDRRLWDEGWAALAARVPDGAPRPRVYIEEFRCPPKAAGGWVPDMVRIAGGEPFLTPPGSGDWEVSWEEMMEFDPQLVLLLGLDRAPEEWMAIEGWDRVEAAREGRIYSVEGKPFSAPGLDLLDGGRLLQALIGEAFWGWP